MGLQDRMRAMVIRNLSPSPKGSGVALTLTKETEGSYDPGTSTDIPGKKEDFKGSGIRISYKTFDYKNTAIEYGDFKIYLSPLLLDGTECPRPVNGDKITIGTETATVINLERWNSNELECGYKLQMRN